MSDGHDEAKSLAAYALGQMLQKKSSVEVAVRWVLRIATLKHHLQWRMWAQMNLITLTAEDVASASGPSHKIDAVLRMLDDVFSPSGGIMGPTSVVENVLESYWLCRRLNSEGLASDSIARLETVYRDYRRMLRAKWTEDTNEHSTRLSEVLNNVKNRAQTYLSSVEADVLLPT